MGSGKVYSFSVVGTFSNAPLAVVSGITDLFLRDENGVTTLYAAGRSGGGLLSLDVNTGISLNDYVVVPANGNLSVPSRLGVVTINGLPSIILTGPDGLLVGGYRINADGSLGAATVITGSPTTAITAQACLEVDGNQIFYVAAEGTNAITVGQISASGAMTTLQTLSLGSAVMGRDISDLTEVTVGGQQMLIATSAARDRIDVFAVGQDGRLTLMSNFGVADGLWTDAPAAMSTVEVAGQTYLVLAATGSSSLTVLRLEQTGKVTVVDHVIDTLDTRFDGAEAVATVTVAGRVFVLAGGADDGINLFALMPDGRLVLVGTVLNASGLGMTNVAALTAQVSGNGIDVFVAGEGTGITRLRVDLGALALPQMGNATDQTLTGTAAGDQLFGGAGDDRLNGAAGRDILSDGTGQDTLAGGDDADIFVLAPDGALDWVTDFELGVDRIDLSEWGRVYDLTGLTWYARANGFAVSFGDEMLEVRTANGAGLTAAQFASSDFFGLWHLTGIVPITEPPPEENGNNDVFTAGLGAETLDGGIGFDTVDYANATTGLVIDMLSPLVGTGFAAGDAFIRIEEVLGGAYSDSILGTSRGDVLQGMNGNDTLDGRSGSDSLFGGAGRDMLRASAGADTYNGGSGVDTIDYTSALGAVQVNLGTGAVGGAAEGHVLEDIENIIGSDFDDVLTGSNETGQYFGGRGNDVIFGAGGNDLLQGDEGNDTLMSGSGAEILVGGAGFDIVDFSQATTGVRLDLRNSALSSGFAAYDTYQEIEGYSGSDHDDTLIGTAEVDYLYGGEGGDDLLSGRGGNDWLFGGRGNDRLIGTEWDDYLYGGTGFDTVDYAGATAAIRINLASPDENLGAAIGDRLSNIEAIVGTNFNDTLIGGAEADWLDGCSERDILFGQGGDDTLCGGDGADTVVAGSGAEHLFGGEGWDVLNLLGATGDLVLDLSQPSASTGIAEGDVISGFEMFVTGAGNDTLRGTAETEYFYGGAGNDTAFSNGGNDRFYGGEGNDRYFPGQIKEFFIGGGGYDTVDFSFATAGLVLDLRSRVAGTVLAARDGYRDVEAFVGSSFGDTLRGSLGADVFFGQNGNDFLFGRGGGDTLWGGNGDDTIIATDWAEALDGGANFDVVDYAGAAMAVRIDLGNPTSNGGAAAGDRLSGFEAFAGSAFDDTLVGAAEVDWLYGGDGNDSLFGAAEDDILTGGDGADTLYGGSGNDLLWGGLGADVFEGHSGTDSVGFLPVSARGVTADLAIPANNRGGAARDLFVDIEGLIGTRYGDTLNGDQGHNVLTGGGDSDRLLGRFGNDSLYGDDGNDTLYGAEGNDALFGGSGADSIDGGAGFDTVYFTGATAALVDLITPANNRNAAAGDRFVFVESLSGSSAGDGFYGDTSANLFQGQAGNDALVGRGGNDTLIGGADNDFINGGVGLDQLYGGSGSDRFVFGEGDGADIVFDFSIADRDVILCTRALVGSTSSGAAVVEQFGSISGGMAVLNFGNGDRITLSGVTSLDGLALAIQIL